jgi:hypothetical protein
MKHFLDLDRGKLDDGPRLRQSRLAFAFSATLTDPAP